MSSAPHVAAPSPAMTSPMTTQPKAQSMRMNPLGQQNVVNEEAGQHGHSHAKRLRGGGAAKDCFISLFACFVCFECCEGCCDCCADILCCPCEMCC